MAYNAQNGGVYILINGDASPLQRKLEDLRGKVSKTAKQIETELQGVFGRADISKFANSAIGSFARLRTGIRAMDTDLRHHMREWENYGKQIGLTEREAKKLAQTVSSSLNTQAVKQVESALRSLQRQTGMTNAEVMKLAQEMGAAGVAAKKAFSELGIRSSAQIKQQITDIKAAFDQLKNSGTASAQDIARAQTAMQTKIAALNKELKGTSSLFGSLRTGAAGFVTSIGAGTASVAALTTGLIAFQKAALESKMAMERLEAAYATIFGGKEGARAQLEVVKEQAKAVGQEFMATAEAAKGLFAAGNNSTLAPQLNDIFKAFSNAGGALQLTQEEMNRVFLALSQMISKGKVQAEELRNQMGEVLPGAFQRAADAMGMSTAALDKFMSEGKLTAEDLLPKLGKAFERDFGEAAKRAAETLSGSIANMQSEWEQFKANVAASGPAKFIVQVITEFLSGQNVATENLRRKQVAEDWLKKAGIEPDELVPDTDMGRDTSYKRYSKETLELAYAQVEAEQYVASETKKIQDQMVRQENKMFDERTALLDKYSKRSDQKKLESLKEEKAKLIQSRDQYIEHVKKTEKDATIQADLLKKAAKDYEYALDGINKDIKATEKAIANAGKSGSGAATKAANAQAKYNTTLENTQNHIKALQEQLKLDKGQTISQKKIALEEQYQRSLRNTYTEIEKQVRAKSITADQGERLKALKKEENSLEYQVKLRELENKAVEENLSHLQEQLGFYDELAQMSGNYATSMQLQNQIIDIQAQKYRELKTIPEEMIQQWEKWKKLEASTDPFAGAFRGLTKFAAEYGNQAKQWEKITYNFATSFEQNIHNMFDGFLETGKFSFDSMADLFKNLLKQMAYQALVQPVVLSVVNGVTGAIMGTGTAQGNVAGMAGAASGMGAVQNLAGSAIQSYAMGKVGGALMNWGGGVLNNIGAYVMPSTFASTAAQASVNTVTNAINGAVGTGASSLPTQTLSGVLSSGWTMGAGLAGGLLGSQVIVPALGIKEGTGTSIGGMLGGAGGTLGGAMLGAQFGSFGGPIGAGLGALVGTVLGSLGGSLFGGQEETPEFGVNGSMNLGAAVKALQSGRSLVGPGTGGNQYNTHTNPVIQATWWKDNGYDRGVVTSTRAFVGQALEQAAKNVNTIYEAYKALGDKQLAQSFQKALNEYGDVKIDGYWEEESPDLEKFGQKITEKYYEALFASMGQVNYDSIVKNNKGEIAKTQEEVTTALMKALSVLSIGEGLEDEMQEKFKAALEKPLVSALNKFSSSNVFNSLTIGKSGFDENGKPTSTLADWGVVMQAFQQMDAVKSSIEELLHPTKEITKKLNEVRLQWAEWETSLANLGWSQSKINRIDKERITYLKRIASDTMKAYEEQNKYKESLVEMNDTFKALNKGLEEQGVDKSYLENLKKRQNAAISAFVNDVLAGFEKKSDISSSIKSIGDDLTQLYKALNDNGIISAKSSLITKIETKRIELLKEYAEEAMKAYEAENQFVAGLKEINDTFTELYNGLKSQGFDEEYLNSIRVRQRQATDNFINEQLSVFDENNSIYTSIKEINTHFDNLSEAAKTSSYSLIRVNEIENKRVEVLRKYVKSLYDSWQPQDELTRSLQEVNQSFEALAKALREIGASASTLTDIEEERAKVLKKTEDSILRSIDQALSLRITALTSGQDSVQYASQNLAYQQENELSQLADQIGEERYQYKLTSAVQKAEQIQDALNRLEAERLAAQQSYTSEITNNLSSQLSTAQEQLSTAQRIKSTFDSIYRSLKDVRRNLWTGQENLLGTRYQEAYSQFNETYRKALGGDEEALKELGSIGTTVLSLAKEQVSTRGEYDKAFYDVDKKLKKAEDYAAKQVSLAEKDIAKTQAIVDKLTLEKELAAQTNAINGGAGSITRSLAQIDADIAVTRNALQQALKNISDTQNAWKAAQQKSASETISSISGMTIKLSECSLSEEAQILAVKAALMNTGQTLARGQEAGGWTMQSVLDEITKNGMTFDEWYNRYGKKEIETAAENAGYIVDSSASMAEFTQKILQGQTTGLIGGLNSVDRTLNGLNLSPTITNQFKPGITFTPRIEIKVDQNGKATVSTSVTPSSTTTSGGSSSTTTTTTKPSSSGSSSSSTSSTSSETLSSLSSMLKTALQTKADAMVQGYLLGSGQQKSDSWTMQKVLDVIHSAGMTAQQWYNVYGESEIKSLQTKTTKSTKYSSDYALLVAKASQLNSQKYLGKTNWRADNTLAEIKSKGLTLAQWYDKYGKAEGFKAGGITPQNEPFWVGEEGPELMMSPQQYGVLNNKDSLELMRPRRFEQDNVSDEISREANNILRQVLRKIDQLEYDSHKVRQYIQKWDNDGLPATATY